MLVVKTATSFPEYSLPPEAFLQKNAKSNATKEMANVEVRKIAENKGISFMDLMIAAVETDLWHELVYALDSSNDDNVDVVREQLIIQAEIIVKKSEGCNYPDCGCPHFMC